MADECSKSPTGKHDPVSPPGGSVGYSTAAPRGRQSGSWSMICSWCGLSGTLLYHEELCERVGHGPYAKEVGRVDDELRWSDGTVTSYMPRGEKAEGAGSA